MNYLIKTVCYTTQTMVDIDKAVSEVFELLQNYGHNNYVGERVTCLQHSLQCAKCAESEGASKEIIIGALLHDIGHLLGLAQDLPRMITQGRELGAQNHECLGGDFLKERCFPQIVCDIVRGHVNAKRYLVVKERGYNERLSDVSKETLVHQGGPMSHSEAAAFEDSQAFSAILKMRTWDERAKNPSIPVDQDALMRYKKMCLEVLTET